MLMKKRILIILTFFSLGFALLGGRLFWIQIVKGDFYLAKAFEQHNSERIITPSRGMILDRNEKQLAVSASAERVSINPIELRKSIDNVDKLVQEMAVILEMDTKVIKDKINKNNRYETIKRRVSKKVGDKIRDLRAKEQLAGVYVDEDAKRFYPNKNLASHVVGFTGDDNQGLYGVELVFDEILRGKEGKILSEVDVLGRPLPLYEERRIDPTAGHNIVLTIDETIQHFVEKELERVIISDKIANGASAIIMDPQTGDILAMASKPDFDPNLPKAAPMGIDTTTWKGNTSEEIRLLEKTVWRNKAVMDSYEPGSTFKAVTTAMGFEEKAIALDTSVNDRTLRIAGHNINCWKPNAHGEQPFYKAVQTSCNPVFVEVATNLGISTFYQYMRKFGFYEPTGIILPGEATSIIHTQPMEIDMATASFGQRFQITPLQLVSAYSAIVNGGNLYKPRLVKELRDQTGITIETFDPKVVRVPISTDTSDEVRKVLEGVVSEGTGKNAYVKGYRIGGKTGTSETLEEGHYIASFAGFAPADNPQIVVLVVLDNPQGGAYYGGTVAAPVAGRIFEQTLNYLGVERIYSEEDRKNMAAEIYVPDVRDKTIEEAKQLLTDAGLQYSIEDEKEGEGIVFEQNPKPGVFISKESNIILYTKPESEQALLEIPNVEGYSIQDASYILRRNGFNIRTFGLGNAFRQSIPAGETATKGSIVEVEFKSLDTH